MLNLCVRLLGFFYESTIEFPKADSTDSDKEVEKEYDD